MGFGISFTQTLFVLAMLPVYFAPTIIAIRKNHPHKTPIILVNVFGGLLGGIGWIVALVWCFIEPRGAADEIRKLHEMLEDWILTQEEFERKKRSLLEEN